MVYFTFLLLSYSHPSFHPNSIFHSIYLYWPAIVGLPFLSTEKTIFSKDMHCLIPQTEEKLEATQRMLSPQ